MSVLPGQSWGLGKLGVLIVVVVGAGVLVYVLFFGPSSDADPNQGAVRSYYESGIGGAVPSTIANRLHVEVCDLSTPIEEDGHTAIVQCDVRIGKRAYSPCFGFDVDDRVVSGPYQITRSECDRLVYDPVRRDFVLSRG